jgi:hypothetical protein
MASSLSTSPDYSDFWSSLLHMVLFISVIAAVMFVPDSTRR